MWKQNRVKVIVTTVVTLLPCVIGLIIWQRLPERMPIHFNFSGVADGWGASLSRYLPYRDFSVYARLSAHLQ